MSAQRHFEKFTDAGGSITATFSLNQMVGNEEQAYNSPVQDVTTGDYPHRYLGMAPAKKAVRKIAVSFMIVTATSASDADDAVDNLFAACARAGLGKLYTIDENGDERWCWAEVSGRPSVPIGNQNWQAQPVTTNFTGYSDWFGTALSTFTTTVTSGQSPKSDTWTNPGNAEMLLAITAAALGSAGFSAGFSISNTTLPSESVTTARASASTSSRVEIDRKRQRVRYSPDAGANWVDDYNNATKPPTKADWGISLDPGGNAMVFTVGGTPNVTFTGTGYPTWH